ncbi:MAG: hypothetical protein ACYS18_12815 [Planctomycetota bacterium]
MSNEAQTYVSGMNFSDLCPIWLKIRANLCNPRLIFSELRTKK